MSEGSSLPLVGLAGDNPLAFLAAVGTLRTLERVWPARGIRMSWTLATNWHPVLHIQGDCSPEALVAALTKGLANLYELPEFDQLGRDLPVSADQFIQFAKALVSVASLHDRSWADLCAALGCDAYSEEGDLIQDTALRTMSGAGHQHFLEFIRVIAESTTADHLKAALFATWTYGDPRPSMRWDPQDDRRYALRASDPGDSNRSPIMTVRGANRLAIEALPCFPTAPQGGRVRTRAFSGIGSGTIFCWPIWKVPISLPTFKSLLGHPEIVEKEPSRDQLEPLGVAEIFRSRRLTVGRFRNFTTGMPCWGVPIVSFPECR